MTQNRSNQAIINGKPVNINISFNISRKQVTQNINPVQHSYNIKAVDKSLNNSNNGKLNKRSKTPQLAQTDRNVYNSGKDKEIIQDMRPTLQLKRKKRRKSSTGDHNIDKTLNFPFFYADVDKSLPSHKRGFTAATMNKTSVGPRAKKETTRLDHSTEIINITNEKKGEVKPMKNLKVMLKKLIDNELSKRSLPLPTMPNKSKYLQSASLTSRKGTSKKKRQPKSQMTVTQRKKRSLSQSVSEQQLFHNPKILEKLNKSNENSLLISEADQIDNDDNEKIQLEQNQYDNVYKKKIVIRTDQSIDCIGEIHELERKAFREGFFQVEGNENYGDIGDRENRGIASKTKDKIRFTSNNNTIELIQTYIDLLNNYQEPQPKSSTYGSENMVRQKSNVNEKVQIYDGKQYLNAEDLNNINELLGNPGYPSSRKTQKNKAPSISQGKYLDIEDPLQDISLVQSKNVFDSNQDERQMIIQSSDDGIAGPGKQEENNANNDKDGNILISHTVTVFKADQDKKNHKGSKLYGVNQGKKSSQAQSKKFQENLQNQSPVFHLEKQVIYPVEYEQKIFKGDEQVQFFRPFVSNEMGRDQLSSNSEERNRLNELKRHQLKKWGNLLEYIKSSMTKKEIDTQEVLQQVYDYLSKAKIDLINEAKTIIQSKGSSSIKKERLEEQFTNRLSAQIEQNQKSSKLECEEHQQKDNRQQQSDDQQQNGNEQQNYEQPQHSQILSQEAQSFKQEYESYEQPTQIKLMNLSTIQAALKHKLQLLTAKKQKQLTQLDQLLQEGKISATEHSSKKQHIEQDFKTQSHEILSIKKNIWKGYNEAKGILDKSYISSRVEEEFLGSDRKKNSKMMKCLSETYLNKGSKINYKLWIEEEQRKKLQSQEEQQSYINKSKERVEVQCDDSDGTQSRQQINYDQQGQVIHEGQYHDQQRPQKSKQLQGNAKQLSVEKSQSQQSQSQKSQVFNYQSSSQLSNDKKVEIDEEFQVISRKLNQLKQEHESSLNSPEQKRPKPLIVPVLERRAPQQLAQTKHHLQPKENEHMTPGASPMICLSSPTTSLHYEEIEKDLKSNDDDDHSNDDDSYESADSYLKENYNYATMYGQQGADYVDGKGSESDQYEDEEKAIIEQQRISSPKNGSIEAKGQQNISLQPQVNLSPRDQLHESPSLLKRQPKLATENQSTPQSSVSSSQLKGSQIRSVSQDSVSPKIIALTKKLKYLTEQDKEDIFQFMFLDLCIELYQQPCHENRLMESINAHVAKQKQLAKRKKGVKTNLNVVKDYLKRFCGYVVRTNKDMLKNLNVPMGPTAIEMLKYMHQNDQIDDSPVDDNEGIVTLIIPVNVFDTFERTLLPTLQFEKYYDNEDKEHERTNFLKNILHIHNKALFDALNEFLDQQRPFGIWGKPFPWKKSTSFLHKFSEAQQEEKLKKSAEKVVESCSYVCGLMVDKEESLVGNAKISQGYIEQIRQDRISRMLANEMIQTEDRWVFYDDEETEVMVQMSNYLWAKILREITEDMLKLSKRSIELGSS